jgi:hypothetical protein
LKSSADCLQKSVAVRVPKRIFVKSLGNSLGEEVEHLLRFGVPAAYSMPA